MSRFTLDSTHGDAPKRGDLMVSMVRQRQRRMWIILAVRQVKPQKDVPRFKIWMERWWQLEPDLRVRLWQSAERAGGQQVIQFTRYPAKKKRKTFEQYLGA
jgi:hypothetical protein